MKARHLCAIFGVAIAAGTVFFMASLTASNDHQSLNIADRLIKTVKVEDSASTATLQLDFRPNGRVMQGPPMIVTIATSKDAPYEGCIVTKALFYQRRIKNLPPVGSMLKLVGKNGVYEMKIAGYLPWDKPLRGYPNIFVSDKTKKSINETWRKFIPRTAEEIAPSFKSDAGRDLDRAKPLLLWGAALTALSLLLNTLFLSIEARRKELSTLRMLGMTRYGVFCLVLKESMILSITGYLLGIIVSSLSLTVYVALDKAMFPEGPAFSHITFLFGGILTPVIAAAASLLALKKILEVKPLENPFKSKSKKTHLGMLIAFAFGFGAFVAVEVWGASLMSAFIPSKEWPDAIASILPGGVSSYDIEKLVDEKGPRIEGVKRIHELAPLQVNILPLEELKTRNQYRNALLLASDYLPRFKFSSGNHITAEKLIRAGDNCVITEMMARARSLKNGDKLRLDCGRGLVIELNIVGIVDLNWHLVTSRGLLRGLNRKPTNTDGPVFVSFDTLESCDLRPPQMVNMTHLWLDYTDDFLKEHGVFEAGRIVEKSIINALGGAYRFDDDGTSHGNTLRVHTRDEIADGTIAHGADIIGSMARIPFIFIAVVSLGFVAMLVAYSDNRKREFVILRSIGATRFDLNKILFYEAFTVAVKGTVIGLLFGAFFGWLFTWTTRAAMANWGIPPSFAAPTGVIIKGAIAAIVFSLLVSVPTSMVIISRATRK